MSGFSLCEMCANCSWQRTQAVRDAFAAARAGYPSTVICLVADEPVEHRWHSCDNYKEVGR